MSKAIVTSDIEAAMTIALIAKSTDELNVEVARINKAKTELDLELANAKTKYESDIQPHKAALKQFFDTIPLEKKDTKSKSKIKYTIPGTKFVLSTTSQEPELKPSNALLVDYLSENYPDLVAIEKKPKWADFKPNIEIIEFTDLDTDEKTLTAWDSKAEKELPFVQVVTREDKFEVKC